MERKYADNKEYQSNIDIIPALLTPNHITNHQHNISPLSNPQNEQTSDMVIRERLHKAIELKHIDLFMQPIVTLPQRHIAFYEFFGRLHIKAGQYIPAQDYMELANEEHIISNLDTIFLTQSLKVLNNQKDKCGRLTSYFINIKPFTVRNKDFMRNLVALLSNRKDIAHSLIFEMHHNDFLMLSPAEKKILDELSKVGCRFSLDHITDIPTDIEKLGAQNISFIKINARTIMSNGETQKGFEEIISKKDRLKNYNIGLIVEKIESETELIELLDYDIKYGQGFLFGRPDFTGVYT